jgi:hypothetical protein
MEQYLATLESIAADAALAFPGKNRVRPFPKIRSAEVLRSRLKDARRQIRLMEKDLQNVRESFSWRLTEPLRLLKKRLGRKPHQ